MYYYERRAEGNLEAVEKSVRNARGSRGFGVLTEIDVQAKLKEKLGVSVPSYKILGACSPGHAHEALAAEPNLGVLLPCSVMLRQEGGTVVVACVRPSVQLGKTGNPLLEPIAIEIERKLTRAVDEATRT